MNAGLFLFIFLGTQARIFILRCLTTRIFNLKKLPAPPPLSESTVRPLTKRDQFQPFPNSTDCHTKHIAMPHRLWPSYLVLRGHQGSEFILPSKDFLWYFSIFGLAYHPAFDFVHVTSKISRHHSLFRGPECTCTIWKYYSVYCLSSGDG